MPELVDEGWGQVFGEEGDEPAGGKYLWFHFQELQVPVDCRHIVEDVYFEHVRELFEPVHVVQDQFSQPLFGDEETGVMKSLILGKTG